MKVGFAGAGSMAAAMARGWAGGEGGPEAMAFCDLDADRARALADEVGGTACDSLDALAARSDLVVLAVKPGALDAVARELGGSAPALLSILAATPVERVNRAFPGVPAFRVMPNQPVAVRRGVLCYPPPERVPQKLAGRVISLLGVLGHAVEVPEPLIDAAMAVMSCSPAYLALVDEALAEAGVREGLDRHLARQIVAETVAGTGELMLDVDPGALRRAVAPPGGATEAGLAALERHGFVDALDAAVEASLERFR